jgi:hypothetical protein
LSAGLKSCGGAARGGSDTGIVRSPGNIFAAENEGVTTFSTTADSSAAGGFSAARKTSLPSASASGREAVWAGCTGWNKGAPRCPGRGDPPLFLQLHRALQYMHW